MADEPRIVDWRRRVVGQMRNEVLDLNLRRDVWRRTQTIIAANQTLPRSYWWDWLAEGYASCQAMYVRRQADRDHRSVGLLRLMLDVEEHADLLTRDRWIALFTDVYGNPAGQAERQWRQLVGDDDDACRCRASPTTSAS